MHQLVASGGANRHAAAVAKASASAAPVAVAPPGEGGEGEDGGGSATSKRARALSRRELAEVVVAELQQRIPQLGRVPVVPCSAVRDLAGIEDVLPAAADAHARWSRKVRAGAGVRYGGVVSLVSLVCLVCLVCRRRKPIPSLPLSLPSLVVGAAVFSVSLRDERR